jgi:hypothetical protein
MNDDALEILNFLPFSFKTQQEQEYVKFLWETFETNYLNKKYQFAYLAYHMLFMSFVYFNIWQIRMNNEKDFKKALVGFNKNIEKEILEASSPFTFHRVNESGALRFFKLIGCNNQKVGQLTKIVKDRNDIAHSNGNIFYNNQKSADDKINNILVCIRDIQEMTKPIICDSFKVFLEENWNPEDREFLDDEDQIREIFIYKYYLSKEDIKFCLDFNIMSFSENEHFEEIRKLITSFKEQFKEE